jgi:hypothetical protein
LAGAAIVASTLGLLALGSACDDDGETSPGPTTSAGTSTGSTGGGGTGGTGGDTTSSGGTGGTGGTPTGSGGSTASDTGTVSGTNHAPASSIVSAAFADGSPSEMDCTYQTVGPCLVSTCDLSGAGGGGPTQPHAGNITLTGGLRDVTLTPDANGRYPSDSAATTLFNSGSTVAFAAAGDTIPSFSANLSAPPGVTWGTPDLSSHAITIDTTSDLSLTWSGATSDLVEIAVGGMTAGVDLVSALCSYDANAGSGTIPSTNVLDQIASYVTGTITVHPTTVETVTAGGYDVTLKLADTAEYATATFTD